MLLSKKAIALDVLAAGFVYGAYVANGHGYPPDPSQYEVAGHSFHHQTSIEQIYTAGGKPHAFDLGRHACKRQAWLLNSGQGEVFDTSQRFVDARTGQSTPLITFVQRTGEYTLQMTRGSSTPVWQDSRHDDLVKIDPIDYSEPPVDITLGPGERTVLLESGAPGTGIWAQFRQGAMVLTATCDLPSVVRPPASPNGQ